MSRCQDAPGRYAGIFASKSQPTGDKSTEEQLLADATIAAQTFLVALDVAADE